MESEQSRVWLMRKRENREEQYEALEMELSTLQAKYDIIKDYSNCALWEYFIKDRRLVLSRKLDGKWNDVNMVIEDYQNTMHQWGLVHPKDWKIFDSYCLDMDQGKQNILYELRQVTDNETYEWLRYIGQPVFDRQGQAVKIVGKTLDITEEMNHRQELLKKASMDSLTGLLNKEATHKMIEEYLTTEEARQHGGTFLIIDIDNFKGFNDTWGHMFGDVVLTQVAETLNRCTQQNALVGRIGGDEFCIYLKGMTKKEEIVRLIDQILNEIRNLKLQKKQPLTLSMGIAVSGEDVSRYDEFYKYADLALYETKERGKNGYSFFEKRMLYSERLEVQTRTDIDSIPQKEYHEKQVEKNLYRYAFSVLNDNDDWEEILKILMPELAEFYHLSEVLIESVSRETKKSQTVAYWDNVTREVQFGGAAAYAIEEWNIICRYFKTHAFYLAVDNDESRKNILLQIPVFWDEDLNMLVSYRRKDSKWMESECEMICSFTKAMGDYYIHCRKKEEKYRQYELHAAATQACEIAFYGVQRVTGEVVFMNESAKQLFPSMHIGDSCYQTRNKDKKICQGCPVFSQKGNQTKKICISGTQYLVTTDEWNNKRPVRIVCYEPVRENADTQVRDEKTGLYTYEFFHESLMNNYWENREQYAIVLFQLFTSQREKQKGSFRGWEEAGMQFCSHLIANMKSDELGCYIKNGIYAVIWNQRYEVVSERVQHMIVSFEASLAEKMGKRWVRAAAGIYFPTASDIFAIDALDKAYKLMHESVEEVKKGNNKRRIREENLRTPNNSN